MQKWLEGRGSLSCGIDLQLTKMKWASNQVVLKDGVMICLEEGLSSKVLLYNSGTDLS